MNENIDDEYKDAMLAGKNNANCMESFPKCIKGHGLLDDISLIQETVVNVIKY